MLTINVSGLTGSGKTTELLRIAAELTMLNKTVAFISDEEDYRDLHQRHLDNGGRDRLFIVKRTVADAIEAGERSWSIDYMLTETTVKRVPLLLWAVCARIKGSPDDGLSPIVFVRAHDERVAWATATSQLADAYPEADEFQLRAAKVVPA